MKKNFNFGKIDYMRKGRKTNTVTVTIEYKENEKGQKVFSATGKILNARGSGCLCGGQCLDEIAKYVKSPTFKTIYRLWKLYHLNDMHPECEHQRKLGWNDIAREKVKLYNWTLNTSSLREQKEVERKAMNAMKSGNTLIPTEKDKFYANLKYHIKTEAETLPEELAGIYEADGGLLAPHIEVKELGWLSPSEHSRGILEKKCPVCGYKYGSSFNYLPIPEEDEKIIYELLK